MRDQVMSQLGQTRTSADVCGSPLHPRDRTSRARL